eukprot:1545664-Rhodomonas_salina.1
MIRYVHALCEYRASGRKRREIGTCGRVHSKGHSDHSKRRLPMSVPDVGSSIAHVSTGVRVGQIQLSVCQYRTWRSRGVGR